MSGRVAVEVDGRTLELSNLDKVLYPEAGFTKGEVIDYYTRVAPVLLPHLAGRPLTRIRVPERRRRQPLLREERRPAAPGLGAHGDRLPAPGLDQGAETIDYVVADELPTLVWLANLAALELHTPQWKVGRGTAAGADRLVRRPGPGRAGRPGASAARWRCCCASGWRADGLAPATRRRGQKGMQLCAPIAGRQSAERVSATPSGWPRSWRRRTPELDRLEDGEEPAARQGVHRLEPEQRGQDDGGAVLAAGPAAPDGVHAADLGRGRGGRGRVAAVVHPGGRAGAGGRRGPLRAPAAGRRPAAAAVLTTRSSVRGGGLGLPG